MKLGPDLQVKLERLKVYKCDRCPKVFPSLNDLMKHMSHHDQWFLSHVVSARVVVERAKIFKCDYCVKSFHTNSQVLLHKFVHIQENVRNQRKLSRIQPNNDILKPYKCPDCDYKFAAHSSLIAHSVLHLPFPHICECGIGYYKLYDLKCHMKLVHGTVYQEQQDEDTKDTLTPDIVHTQKKQVRPKSKPNSNKVKNKKPKKNKWKIQLTDENSDSKDVKLKYWTPPKPDINIRKTEFNKFECPVCKKLFKERGAVYTHYRIHTGERPYSCHLCEKAFTQFCALVKHVLTHTTRERIYVCKHCPKSFAATENRDRHELIHSAEKSYVCPYCNKGFHDPSALTRHKRIHTGDKRYKCPYCPKAFTDVSGLHRHKRLHENMKQFQCDICLKRFNLANYLRIHMNVHTLERKFCCDYCKKFFSSKSNLILHIHRHTISKKNIECQKCHEKFATKDYLKRHIRQVHEHVKFKRVYQIECDDCSEQFKDKHSFQKHYLSTHSGVRCDKCFRYFAGKTHLEGHKLMESVKCEICDEEFFCENMKDRHLYKVHC